jgi:hypothetical protein
MKIAIVEKDCPKCGAPMKLKADMECPVDWLDRLVKLVVCNNCADMMETKRKAQDAIGEACAELVALRHSYGNRELKKEEQEVYKKATEEIRGRLERATKAFMRYLSALHKDPAIRWSPEFVQVLMEKPHAAHQAISFMNTEAEKEASAKKELGSATVNEVKESTTKSDAPAASDRSEDWFTQYEQ